MATSLPVSELQRTNTVTDPDLFLISQQNPSSQMGYDSKGITYGDLFAKIQNDFPKVDMKQYVPYADVGHSIEESKTVAGLDVVQALKRYIDEMLKNVYPVGSIYITAADVNPPFKDLGVEWQRISSGLSIWSTAGTEVGKTLPGIFPTHQHTAWQVTENIGHAAISPGWHGEDTVHTPNLPAQTYELHMNADNVQVGNTLRPPSLGVIMWKRIK